ncbi:MAG: DUF4190 domain-containing protein [Lachnospiraceae bacterium]|nr:DUF4190 domain-containing protein [Lachnospiraceae bacterium]
MDGQNFQYDQNNSQDQGVQTTTTDYQQNSYQPQDTYQQDAYQQQNTYQNSYQSNYQDNTTGTTTPYYQGSVVEEPKETNGLAIAALILGIIALITGCCASWIGIIFGIPGIICAVLSKKKGKSGMATAGLVMSIIGIVIGLAVTLIAVATSAAIMGEISSYDYY